MGAVSDYHCELQRLARERERSVVLMRDKRGMTFAAIGSALGVTAQRAHQLYGQGKDNARTR